MKCASQVKRIDSIRRSPIFSFLTETLNGAVSIRAYGEQERFIRQSDSLLDNSQASFFNLYASNR